jgi:hypothetical protein
LLEGENIGRGYAAAARVAEHLENRATEFAERGVLASECERLGIED